MNEKPVPHYDISQIGSQLRAGRYLLTARVRRHIRSRGWSETEVLECIEGLKVSDFHKSQRHMDHPDRWLDIYRPLITGRRMYVKFTVDPPGAVVILSFCRDGEAH